LLLLQLLERSCVAVCCLSTRLHNTLLPESLLLSCLAGQGQQQLFSWLRTTNISQIQKQRLQQVRDWEDEQEQLCTTHLLTK
jgi:hypothetical protein